MDSLIWGKPEPGRKLFVCQTGWKRTCRLNCWMRETIVLAAWAVGERDVMKSSSTTSVYHIWFERWTEDSPPLYLCSSAINFARLHAYSLNFADFFIVVEFDHGHYHELQTWRWTRIEDLKSETFIILHDDNSTQRDVVLWLIVHTGYGLLCPELSAFGDTTNDAKVELANKGAWFCTKNFDSFIKLLVRRYEAGGNTESRDACTIEDMRSSAHILKIVQLVNYSLTTPTKVNVRFLETLRYAHLLHQHFTLTTYIKNTK